MTARRRPDSRTSPPATSEGAGRHQHRPAGRHRLFEGDNAPTEVINFDLLSVRLGMAGGAATETAAPLEGPSAGAGGKRIALRAIGRITCRGVSSIALGLCLLAVARSTTLGDFGHFMVAYSGGLVVGLVAGVGAPIRALRANADPASDAGALFAVHAGLVLVAFGITFGICAGWSAPSAVYAGLVLALGDTLQNFAIAQTTSRDHHATANFLVLSQRLVPLSVVIVSIVMTKTVYFDVLALAVAVPVLLGLLVPPIFVSVTARRRYLKGVFTEWVGYWAYSLSGLLSQLQVPLLAAVATSGTVAVYAMATRVIGPIAILTASLSAIVVPELTKRLSDRVRFESLFRGVLALSGGYAIVVFAMAWPIALVIAALAGPQYVDGKTVTAAMVVGAGISGCSQSFNSRLLAVGAPTAATKAIIAGGLIALGLILGLGGLDREALLWTVPVLSELVVLAIISNESRLAQPASFGENVAKDVAGRGIDT